MGQNKEDSPRRWDEIEVQVGMDWSGAMNRGLQISSGNVVCLVTVSAEVGAWGMRG